MNNTNSLTDNLTNTLNALGTVAIDPAIMAMLDKYPDSGLLVGLERTKGGWYAGTGVDGDAFAPHPSEKKRNYFLQHMDAASNSPYKDANFLSDIIPSVVNRMNFLCLFLDAYLEESLPRTIVTFRLYRAQNAWCNTIQIINEDSTGNTEVVEVGSVA